MNKRFKRLLQRYGFSVLRSGKGSHRIITNGDRKLTCGSKVWRDGNPPELENLEKQIRRATA